MWIRLLIAAAACLPDAVSSPSMGRSAPGSEHVHWRCPSPRIPATGTAALHCIGYWVGTALPGRQQYSLGTMAALHSPQPVHVCWCRPRADSPLTRIKTISNKSPRRNTPGAGRLSRLIPRMSTMPRTWYLLSRGSLGTATVGRCWRQFASRPRRGRAPTWSS
jgi:hypothetical protein